MLSEADLPFLRLASAMPILNYGLFTEQIRLSYPLSHADQALLNDLLDVFSRDIFINKLVRKKNPYILPQYLPTEAEVTEENAKPRAKIVPNALVADAPLASGLDANACGVLSSGGKESLLTYGMLKEAGADVYPIYVNESGGHWRTALAAHRYHSETEPNTMRVWLNVDRFYTFMLDHLQIIRPDHRKVWLDTYPLRLCIFPVYVFYLLPVFAAKRIGNLLIGSEFDDPRLTPVYRGIKHYFGVYDQTQDYDLRMEEWYQKRVPNMRQWSAVRPISGLIVERILTRRYPQLARVQRSCHSCRLEGGEVVPCGDCSKCLGIQLFLQANGADPTALNYTKQDVALFAERFNKGGLRLDEDEKEHAAYLCSKHGVAVTGKEHPHIDSIHLYKATGDLQLVPAQFRAKLLGIIGQYTSGYSKLDGEKWVPAKAP
ncbi:MAG: hypothetical protein NWE93_09470 [Candidatus Bathyarchaeota archaeon]|nr:hypothetical protein [Candidatus Bathyarchaeota archaeon]